MAASAPLAMPCAASRASPRPAAAPPAPALATALPCVSARGPRGFLASQPPTRRLRLLPPAPADFNPKAIGSAAEAAPAEGLATKLQGVEVFDLSGKAVPIVDLWKDRKAVVAFARHFGCVLCRKRADLLASKQDVMQAAGVALVLIGPGTVEQAKAFSEQTKFKGAGLKIMQLYMEGYRQDWELSFQENTRTKGGWQQGGLLVAGPGADNILYIHKDKEAGDDPEMEDVLRACCS